MFKQRRARTRSGKSRKAVVIQGTGGNFVGEVGAIKAAKYELLRLSLGNEASLVVVQCFPPPSVE